MDFYKQIADYYEDIFPLNFAQLNFARKSFRDTSTLSVLDIGCGTGSLSAELAKYFQKVEAVDLDEQMLEKAKLKNAENVSFRKMNMLKIQEEFASISFDAIVCFGNTLVHLEDSSQLLNFFKQAKAVLKKNGKLLFQIINYDRIIDKNIQSLPTIENETIRFIRNYRLHPDQKKLDFKTSLTIKHSKQLIKNTIPLYPTRSREINHLLREAGFTKIFFFSNFKREAFSANSIPLVVEAS